MLGTEDTPGDKTDQVLVFWKEIFIVDGEMDNN